MFRLASHFVLFDCIFHIQCADWICEWRHKYSQTNDRILGEWSEKNWNNSYYHCPFNLAAFWNTYAFCKHYALSVAYGTHVPILFSVHSSSFFLLWLFLFVRSFFCVLLCLFFSSLALFAYKSPLPCDGVGLNTNIYIQFLNNAYDFGAYEKGRELLNGKRDEPINRKENKLQIRFIHCISQYLSQKCIFCCAENCLHICNCTIPCTVP